MSSQAVVLPGRRTGAVVVVAASIGNFIDFFEYGLYGLFAAVIALNFFPGASLIPTFAVFAVSFVLRPLGAVVLGHWSDRLGRRSTLAVTLVGISVATFVIGILPPRETIGILAPVVLVIARAVQGFCTGGEFGGATALMVENAPARSRTRYGSWQFVTQNAGVGAASVVGTVLTATLSAGALNDWGWRIPFILTLPLGLIGLYLRLRTGETAEFAATRAKNTGRAPVRDVLARHWRVVLAISGYTLVGTTATYLIDGFWPAYLVRYAGIAQSDVFVATMVATVAAIVTVPLWAWWADRIGRHKPFLLCGTVALGVAVFPSYFLVYEGHSLATLVLGYLLLFLPLAVSLGSAATAISDAFPTAVRCTGVAIGYSVGVSIFGGATPLIMSGIIAGTGAQIATAWYLSIIAVVSVIAVVLFPATGRAVTPGDGHRRPRAGRA